MVLKGEVDLILGFVNDTGVLKVLYPGQKRSCKTDGEDSRDQKGFTGGKTRRLQSPFEDGTENRLRTR